MIKPIPNPKYNSRPPVLSDREERVYTKHAANAINRAFDWASTAEGSDFWGGVHQRLTQIAEDGILKE